jgi:excinuclease ABC subunit A
MSARSIIVHGAREHNLKNIHVEIPRDKLVVVTGISGSGKSSLAFDTIYAEGQRRYVESLSAYARQFLEQMRKPDVDYIEGLPPTISIEQRSGVSNPRSTVATTTEIFDYLRLLYARVGEPHCYKCGRKIAQQSPAQIVNRVLRLDKGTRVMLLAPVVRGRKGEHKDAIDSAKRQGFVRLRVDGEIVDIGAVPSLDKNKKHEIEVVVDRLVIKAGIRSRLADSAELALKVGEGLLTVAAQQGGKWEDHVFSELYACPICGVSLPELTPRMFSFNSPYGACPACDGLGTKLEFDPDLIVSDKSLSLFDGAVEAWRRTGVQMARWYWHVIRRFCDDFGADGNVPYRRFSKRLKKILIYGTDEKDLVKFGAKFTGVIPDLTRRFGKTESEHTKRRLHSYMSELPCPSCGGSRLRPESMAVTVGRKAIYALTRMSIEEAARFFKKLSLSKEKATIARLVLKEIIQRLSFLIDVGLAYITLDRRSATLSGGEAQRIRLATQVGSGLVGVCYALDEPSIGLHQKDNRKLIRTLKNLRDLGNTVIVVEHDETTIRSADHVVDLGPGAGAHGGWVVAEGALGEVLKSSDSLTSQYLRGELSIELPGDRRPVSQSNAITVKGARANNLKNINVSFPLGGFLCVTGVSGSGKSTLVDEILRKALARRIYGSGEKPGAHDSIAGATKIDKVIVIDQSPIGRTPRSNPATYTNVFSHVRALFAESREARIRGYKPGRFSFNVKGGRCEACEGQGTKKIEMHFLPDVYVLCEECKGTRFNRETLEVKFKGKNIAEVLDMTVEEALTHFANFPKVMRLLRSLNDVGLGYIKLGQSSTTLSGGEAQRVKLASELGKVATGRTLYILDEPTTGLHFADIKRLVDVLNRLADLGNTVIVIEHHLDVIKMADYIIDLGPEGGEKGGEVVAKGTPEEVARSRKSYTGKFLREILSPKKRAA